MSKRVLTAGLLAAALLVSPVPFVRALDDFPDPRPVAQEEVDPDGLEGIQAGGANPSGGELATEGSGARAVIRSFFLLARLVGL